MDPAPVDTNGAGALCNAVDCPRTYGAEPKEGFEPPTSRLQGECSVQTELHRQRKEVAAEALSRTPQNIQRAATPPPAYPRQDSNLRPDR